MQAKPSTKTSSQSGRLFKRKQHIQGEGEEEGDGVEEGANVRIVVRLGTMETGLIQDLGMVEHFYQQ